MADLAIHSKKMASLLVGTAVIAFSLWEINWPESASAAPAFVPGVGSHPSLVEPADELAPQHALLDPSIRILALTSDPNE
jgi:hypothetical protein